MKPVWLTWRVLGCLIAASAVCAAVEQAGEPLPGLIYTNARFAKVPWSIHVVQLERSNSLYQVGSLHADGRAIGLETLSEQLALATPAQGAAVAAINGDFYVRDKAYAGASRGLQISAGQLLRGPSGGASFWVDALGEPHTGKVESRFQITWPDGTSNSFGLNGERPASGVELYTSAIGPSTRTVGGFEFVLTRAEHSPWLPLRIGRIYTATVREIRHAGDTALTSDTLILSVGPEALGRFPQVQTGAVARISTASWLALHGINTAISGGPVLLRQGKLQNFAATDSEAYEYSSMMERHPRAAVGWNERYFFLVEVDGRQRNLSVGMTLDELARFLTKLDCEEAMNLDGGGSATLWYNGTVRNSPCDRMEREIANCLAILKRK